MTSWRCAARAAKRCARACSVARVLSAHRCCAFACAQHQSIGQDFALFYEARATFLELRGNFPQAHAAYEAGINRCGAQQTLLAWPLRFRVCLRER